MELAPEVLICLALCLLAQGLAWWWQRQTDNADIVDIVWSLLIVVCGLIYVVMATGDTFHRYIMLLLPVAWYLRLSWHLIDRYSIDKEDGRYQQLRAHWNEHRQAKFFAFFMLQAMLAFVFSFPVYLIANSRQPFDGFDALAVLIALVALVGVTVADYQLRQCKRQGQKGQVCHNGLWRYSRHPNYFFEWLHWLAYPLLGWHAEHGWLLLAYPLLMLLFLLKLTGIPFNEQQNLRSKGEAYRQYQKRTNKFFPGPVRTQ